MLIKIAFQMKAQYPVRGGESLIMTFYENR